MQTSTHSVQIDTPQAMAALGAAVAKCLAAGDIIALSGQIGAGKSVFARSAILAILPVPEDIPSPTFTLVQTYHALDFEIWHCDLYRLTDLSQVDELGLWDAFEDAVCLIEWPQILEPALPGRTVHVDIQVADDAETRNVSFQGPKQKIAIIKDAVHGAG